VNGAFLLVVLAVVIVEGVHRLVAGTGHVHGLPVVVISAIASVVMVIGALILQGDVAGETDSEGDTANVRAVLLDTVADAAAAGGAAVVGAIIAVTRRLYWLDPLVAVIIAAVVGYHVVRLLISVAGTLRRPIAR
jgi:Co/Zn/Cd efflux system component